MHSNVHAVELVFLLLLFFVVAFGALARKLQTPYPIMLVVGGLLLSFIPGIPRISLNPDVVFFVILPPLLYSAAWLTSWREFSHNLISILFLAFGLVTFTVVGVSYACHWFLPGFDWRMGLVLGAVVAPTDAIAATSIASRIGLPKRIVDVLEGESLLNDASALLALEFGIALLMGEQKTGFISGSGRFVYLTLVGIVVGLVIGEIVHRVEHRIDDGPIEIALSILTPYVAYLGAEALHASGVLAVVVCGLYLGRKSSHFFSPNVRLQASAVWGALTFILNGLVFVLIGLQLPYILDAIRDHSRSELLIYGAAFSMFLIVLRLVWVYPGTHLAYFIRNKVLRQQEPTPTNRQIFVVGWTGMRGVISLAAAIALPQTLASGDAFRQRSMIVFLTFSVILVTLVLQGLTLPPLIRGLRLAGAPADHPEELEARRLMLEAALAHLEEENTEEESKEIANELAGEYRRRLGALEAEEKNESTSLPDLKRFVSLSRELLGVERKTAVQLRNQRRISDEVLRELERELDLSEERLSAKRT
ncbi:MAG TPA: Na+/H+ antiporter [Candidatus Sulfotelmatobacter sp.]|nr:Na+/H+ antiporter [Candidatus Sulfotelmatobacter sp.]